MEKEKLNKKFEQLKDAQKKRNYLQVQSIFDIVKKLPTCVWVMMILTSICLIYIIKVDHKLKNQIKLEQKQKHQIRQDLEEVRNDLKVAKAEIRVKDLTIENCLTTHANENQEIAIMRNNLRHKTIAKQFYQAVASELAGRPKINMDYHLEKMFSNNHERASLIKDTWIKDALDLGAINVAELVGKRIELVKDKEKFEAIAAIKKVMNHKRNAFENVIKKQNIAPTWEQECSGE